MNLDDSDKPEGLLRDTVIVYDRKYLTESVSSPNDTSYYSFPYAVQVDEVVSIFIIILDHFAARCNYDDQISSFLAASLSLCQVLSHEFIF